MATACRTKFIFFLFPFTKEDEYGTRYRNPTRNDGLNCSLLLYDHLARRQQRNNTMASLFTASSHRRQLQCSDTFRGFIERCCRIFWWWHRDSVKYHWSQPIFQTWKCAILSIFSVFLALIVSVSRFICTLCGIVVKTLCMETGISIAWLEQEVKLDIVLFFHGIFSFCQLWNNS